MHAGKRSVVALLVVQCCPCARPLLQDWTFGTRTYTRQQMLSERAASEATGGGDLIYLEVFII